MNICIFIGGNKHFTATRLGVKLGEELRQKGFQVTLACVKGKLKAATSLPVYEYTATAKPKTFVRLCGGAGSGVAVCLCRKRRL